MDTNTSRKIDIVLGFFLIQLLRYFKRKKKRPDNSRIKRILCTKLFGFGNIIMIMPAINTLREKYPDAEIDFLTLKPNKPIIECYSRLLNNIYFLKVDKLKKLFFHTLRVIKELKKRKYDFLIDFDQFARFPVILNFFMQSGYSIGFNTPYQYRHYLYDKYVNFPYSIHTVESYYDLVKKGLMINNGRKLKLIRPEMNKKFQTEVNNYLKEKGISKADKLINIHIGVGENARVRLWPHEKFIRLINSILKKNKRIKILLTRAPFEQKEAATIMKEITPRYKDRVIEVKELSLKHIPSLINRTILVISADTGNIHLAAALGKKVIGLYGPNTPLLYGPYTNKKTIFYADLPCSPCMTNLNNKKTNCKNNQCMKLISAENVFKATKKLFK